MNSLLKISFTACQVLFCFAACNPTTGTKAGEMNKDSIPVSAVLTQKKETPVLKDVVLNEKTLFSNNRLASSEKIDVEKYRSLSIKLIDSTAADENRFKYHIVDTLFSNAGLKILLIGREYDSENIVWIVVYDDKHKLIDRLMVYYDNAEGFLSVQTIIKNNELIITTLNDFEDGSKKETATYQLDEHNKIVKQKK